MKVKICGITNLDDARYCSGAGADYLGFIQHEPSPRYIAPEEAKKIIDWLHGTVGVGVFVNTPAEEVNKICTAAGFGVAQLHGDETPADCGAIDITVWKGMRIRSTDSSEELAAAMRAYQPYVEAFVLDAYSEEAYGGTGQSFNWRIAKSLARDFKVFLAGGISSDNVSEADRTVSPYGIDVSSSVEESPGKKDFDKLATLFEQLDVLRSSF